MLSQLNGKKSPKDGSNINSLSSSSTQNGDVEILTDEEVKCISDIAADNNHTSNTRGSSDDKHEPFITTTSESRDTADIVIGSDPSSEDVDINSDISISNCIVDVEGANSMTTIRSEVSSKDVVSTIPVPLEAIPIANDFDHLLPKKSNVVDELNMISRSSTPKRSWLNNFQSDKETVASSGGKVQRRSSVTLPEVCYNFSDHSSIATTGNAVTSSFLDNSKVPPNVTVVGCQVVPVIPVKSVSNSVTSVTPETRPIINISLASMPESSSTSPSNVSSSKSPSLTANTKFSQQAAVTDSESNIMRQIQKIENIITLLKEKEKTSQALTSDSTCTCTTAGPSRYCSLHWIKSLNFQSIRNTRSTDSSDSTLTTGSKSSENNSCKCTTYHTSPLCPIHYCRHVANNNISQQENQNYVNIPNDDGYAFLLLF